MNLQKEFIEFHDNIRLDDENETLREKRDILLNKLNKNISEEAASYTHFNQGSYAMGTGVKPEDGDYDIDVGLKFDIDKADYPDPIKVKKWVRDALEGHTKSVKIRRSCVTVTYQEDGEDAYHVDFAVYASNNPDGKMYIAKGKENSDVDKRIWEISCPQELISEIKNKFSDSKDAQQFRRCIRYLKKWKNHKISSNGNEAPTGIALTILAYNYFLPYKTVDYLTNASEYNDFFALKSMVENIQNAFTLKYDTESGKNLHSIELKLIVEPWNDLFEKMTAKQMDDFYNKIESMSKTLEEVDKEEKRNKACEKLQGIFGEDFPIKYDRSLVGTSESA